MATIRPFAALRPLPEKAARVAAVPYDVVSTSEAREFAAGNPLSFLHVSRPEIDLPDGTDPYSDAVYGKAAENFERLKREAPLIEEEEPSLYLYRLKTGDHEQTGIAGCCSVDEYDADVIRKHERTRRDKEDDRTRHMVALRAQTGPVFLTYPDDTGIDELVEGVRRTGPLYDFTAPDGVTHTVWRATRETTGRLVERFGAVPLLYIADGHHRAASASRTRAHLAAAEGKGHRKGPFNFFLAVLFPAGQVRILAYNRIVKDLGDLTPDRFLAALRERFDLAENAPPAPSRRGSLSVYLDGRWLGLSLGDSRPGVALDVSLLQDRILEPLLGIRDQRTDKRIDFIGGGRGTGELERLVDVGEAAVAFSMFPVSVEDLIAVSDAGRIMPPKSTWFEPKLRDGLLIHPI